MKKTFLLLSLLASLTITAQIKFEVKFSKPLAVLEFMQNLSAKARNNSFKTHFTNSEFNNGTYTDLLKLFDSINLEYSYEFTDYPKGQKIEGSTENLLKKNLFYCQSLDDFRLRSLGLIPLSDINNLILVIKEFTPVYEKLIYEPNKTVFEKQLNEIETLLVTKNIASHFEQAKKFYSSSWDDSIPFVLAYNPLPDSKGFRATAFYNLVVSPLPTATTDYNLILSLALHEISHILYDEQSLPFKIEMDKWFSSNPSKYSVYAQGLVQESWATAVGNGYFFEKLSGKLNPGNWYGTKYVSLMAKEIYPLVKEYIDKGRPADKFFVDQYIKIFEDSFSTWAKDLNYLMMGRYVISDNRSDFEVLDRKFPYRNEAEYFTDFTESSFEKLRHSTMTKFIIVSTDNKKKLALIKNHFDELKNWNPDSKNDFTYFQFLADKSQLIVINLVHNSLEKQLEPAAANTK